MTTAWPAAVAAGWHPVALESEVVRKPLARQLMGKPLVVFRSRGEPAVLLDRCPHRAMLLSGGRVEDAGIICPYHGWQFEGQGRCVAVPGSDVTPACTAQAYPVIVRAGLIWTSLARKPGPFPRLPADMEDAQQDGFWWAVPSSTARLLDAVENLLDPAHPHFLHSRLVRAPHRRRPVRVVIRTGPDGGEAVYHEDMAVGAWIPRLLEGHRLRSAGRYFPPTIGQLAFENRKGLALAISVVFSPEDHDRTRAFAHFATPKGLLPAWFKRCALIALHRPVLDQDRRALARQAESIARFGAADYSVGPLDFLGPVIWRLAHGETVPVSEGTAQIYL